MFFFWAMFPRSVLYPSVRVGSPSLHARKLHFCWIFFQHEHSNADAALYVAAGAVNARRSRALLFFKKVQNFLKNIEFFADFIDAI